MNTELLDRLVQTRDALFAEQKAAEELSKQKEKELHDETMLPRADGMQGLYLWWHGWAIREAFVAGAKWQAERDVDYEQLNSDASLGRQVRQLPEGWLLSNNGDDLNYEGRWDVRDPKGAPPPKGNAFVRGIGETPEDALTMARIVGDVQYPNKAHAALQAIADAKPGDVPDHYDAQCDRCKELIAMAREGLEASDL